MSRGGVASIDSHPRVRYAVNEIKKMGVALERVDLEEVEAWMRVAELEERLADTRAMAERWRQASKTWEEIIFCMGPEPNLERLGEILRIWAVTGE